MEKEFAQNFVLYKARNNGSGAASQFSLSGKKDSVFLEMANQTGKDNNGNASFDWGNKIRFKLGISDIGEVLSVLVGLQKGVGQYDSEREKFKGLYHSNKSGNAILYFGKDESGRFGICLSVKKDGDQTRVQHSMTKGEACVLAVLLRHAVKVMYGWN